LTPTPRVTPTLHRHAGKLHGYTRNLREQISGRSLAFAGAGLALAGTGAAAAVGGFAGPATGAVGPADSVNRASAPIAASQNPGKSDSQPALAKHVLSQSAAATKSAKSVVHGHVKQAGTRAPASHRTDHASAHRQAARHPTFHWTRSDRHPEAWDAIERVAAGQPASHASHASLPAQDQLTPVSTTGPQSWMPMTPARYDNATTIVRQVIAKKMGLRSAVIAVATAMQESTLLNINYGDRDSLGLFQQRPSCGWGTAEQILHPAYAADAFLGALRTYQDRDPGWSEQPLWQTAQGVQASGFPTAYAKWETQAAGLVHSIARHLV
jgi:hypothetical protein